MQWTDQKTSLVIIIPRSLIEFLVSIILMLSKCLAEFHGYTKSVKHNFCRIEGKGIFFEPITGCV